MIKLKTTGLKNGSQEQKQLSLFAAYVHYTCHDSLMGNVIEGMKKRLKYPERKHLTEGQGLSSIQQAAYSASWPDNVILPWKTEGGGWEHDLSPLMRKSRTKAMCEVETSLACFILGPNGLLVSTSVLKQMWLWFQQWTCTTCSFWDVKCAAAFTKTLPPRQIASSAPVLASGLLFTAV